ncbi:MAG: hypothetical protein ACPGVT_12575 [Maricaulaceae bacterium]
MTTPLSPQQEAFAQTLARTGNRSESYRAAYGEGNYTPTSLSAAASRLAGRTSITARLSEIEAELAYMASFTKGRAMRELSEISEAAKQSGDTAALRLARDTINDQAKLAGLGSDGAEVVRAVIVIEGDEAGL